MHSFATTKQISNFCPILARIVPSIVDRHRPIAEDKATDPLLAFTDSALFRSIATLRTSLVAWSTTMLTFWFIEPDIHTAEKLLRDLRLPSYFRQTAQWRDATWRLSRSSSQRSQESVWCYRSCSRCHKSSFGHLSLARLPARARRLLATHTFSPRHFCQTK